MLERKRADGGEAAGLHGSLGAALVPLSAPCHTHGLDAAQGEDTVGRTGTVCHRDAGTHPRCKEGAHGGPGWQLPGQTPVGVYLCSRKTGSGRLSRSQCRGSCARCVLRSQTTQPWRPQGRRAGGLCLGSDVVNRGQGPRAAPSVLTTQYLVAGSSRLMSGPPSPPQIPRLHILVSGSTLLRAVLSSPLAVLLIPPLSSSSPHSSGPPHP